MVPGFRQPHERHGWRAFCLIALLAVITLLMLTAVASTRPESASAHTPCSAHGSYSNGCSFLGTYVDFRCAAANRLGPGTDYSAHAVTPTTGTQWKVYKRVYRSPVINAGCGGLATNQWELLGGGFVHFSTTYGEY